MKVLFLVLSFLLALSALGMSKDKDSEKKMGLEDRKDVILSHDNKNSDGHRKDEKTERKEYQDAEARSKGKKE